MIRRPGNTWGVLRCSRAIDTPMVISIPDACGKAATRRSLPPSARGKACQVFAVAPASPTCARTVANRLLAVPFLAARPLRSRCLAGSPIKSRTAVAIGSSSTTSSMAARWLPSYAAMKVPTCHPKPPSHAVIHKAKSAIRGRRSKRLSGSIHTPCATALSSAPSMAGRAASKSANNSGSARRPL
jgi:hypothetical protein